MGALEMSSHWCTHGGGPGCWVPGAYVGADYSNGNGFSGLVSGVCPGPLLCICVCVSYIDRLATCDLTWGHKLLTEVFTIIQYHPEEPKGLRLPLGTKVHHNMSVNQCLSLETGGQEQLGISCRHVAEGPRGLYCQLLEPYKFLSPLIPLVDLGEGEVTAQCQVAVTAHQEGL